MPQATTPERISLLKKDRAPINSASEVPMNMHIQVQEIHHRKVRTFLVL